MASSDTYYVGFDLGTTNSAAAVFDGENVTVIRGTQGGALTPSVVRIDKKGTVTVGGRARRFLETDPRNTRAEFKRLMGTGQTVEFPASGTSKRPQELAALVLAALRADVEEQIGFLPTAAVVTVPALFEVPQSAASAEAGRLAGLERVELVQEPVASALAAGWTAEDASGKWLVYDLGGGTFDVSLLETRDGLLRVVAHDGDNFLGGRDFDAAIVDHLIREIEAAEGVVLRRDDPAHQAALRQLALAAEEAKIELTRAERAAVALASPVTVGGEPLELDLELDRATLEDFCLPLVDRSIEICLRLLEGEGLTPGDLESVVLVGGPTVMPVVRRRLDERLGHLAEAGHDPMTLVAQGAALYAASAGVSGGTRRTVPEREDAHKLWLKYPAMSSTTSPHVVGRLAEAASVERPASVRLTREAGDGEPGWHSETVPLDAEDAFVATVELLPRRLNRFRVEALTEAGTSVPVSPATLEIVHGLAISDPPLSRSIGVALADDGVQLYFERGVPLPARRSFTHKTVESLAPGSADCALKIPIVQGEFDVAHLCRMVGRLEISGEELRRPLPAGSAVELTLELDRGGHLKARALVPELDQVFEEVAHLLVPEASPEVLEKEVEALADRLAELRGAAFRNQDRTEITRLQTLSADLDKAAAGVAAARGGDEDAGQRARRHVLEIEAEVADREVAARWPELEGKAVEKMAWASSWVSAYGTEAEQRLLDEAFRGVEQARDARSPAQLKRQMRLVRELGNAAWYRQPGAWEMELAYLESRIGEATDLPRAEKLAGQARSARERGDQTALRSVIRQLWDLMPADARDRRRSHESGIL